MNVGEWLEEIELSKNGKDRATKHWNYGPADLADASFWDKMAEVWDIKKDEAKLRRCSNCEYYDNRMSTLKALKASENTGLCKKFKFVCADARVCQAWEADDDDLYEMEMGED